MSTFHSTSHSHVSLTENDILKLYNLVACNIPAARMMAKPIYDFPCFSSTCNLRLTGSTWMMWRCLPLTSSKLIAYFGDKQFTLLPEPNVLRVFKSHGFRRWLISAHFSKIRFLRGESGWSRINLSLVVGIWFLFPNLVHIHHVEACVY